MTSDCLRILLVEDDAAVAADLLACLQEAGHEVLSVEARSDFALTAARLLQPDVVVLNVRLRGPLDGLAVASTLRASRPVPVIFITAQAEHASLLQQAQASPLAILATPLLGRDLCQDLGRALTQAMCEAQAHTL
ncbi:hypothetical protein GCM10023185_22210 [Hymenobacter saemangeumensis]|uniref:Response regulatory domain-containing protein n=1 Tax=Hymenobacter saemangeumensis TaxID=1084522 RepID=A0ABP8IF46_9BACT